jgi:hypothetical protein
LLKDNRGRPNELQEIKSLYKVVDTFLVRCRPLVDGNHESGSQAYDEWFDEDECKNIIPEKWKPHCGFHRLEETIEKNHREALRKWLNQVTC